jgi:hypothetical protein
MEYNAIAWEAYEYKPRNHSSDWYWALGIITVSIVIVSILLGNILFGVFVLLSAFTLALYTKRHPHVIRLEINQTGVVMKNKLYPYDSLESFYIDIEADPDKLVLKSKMRLMPYIIIPLNPDLDYEEIREYLLHYLEEDHHPEPLGHKILDYLGF